jgi:hypothetical protein
MSDSIPMPEGLTIVDDNSKETELLNEVINIRDILLLSSLEDKIESLISYNKQQDKEEEQDDRLQKEEEQDQQTESNNAFLEKLGEVFNVSQEGFDKGFGFMANTLLGPLKLITKPIEEQFGLDLPQKLLETVRLIPKALPKSENKKQYEPVVEFDPVIEQPEIIINNDQQLQTITSLLPQTILPAIEDHTDVLKQVSNNQSEVIRSLISKNIVNNQSISNLPMVIKSDDNTLDEEYKGTLTFSQIKKIDPGAAFLSLTLRELLDKKDQPDISGKFSAGSISGILTKALPIAALAAGAIWMVVDGIRGFFMSDEWNVSKISGALGGALGGMDSGIKGGFKNAGKFALIGAGIGSLIAPGIGTLIGGGIGGIVGGILGFIGGEKIAKALNEVPAFFEKLYLSSVETFMILQEKALEFSDKHPIVVSYLKTAARINPIVTMIETAKNVFGIIRDEELSKTDKVKKIAKESFHFITSGLFRKDGFLVTLVLKVFDLAKKGIGSAIDFISDLDILGKTKEKLTDIFDFGEDIVDKVFKMEFIEGVIDDIGINVNKLMTNAWETMKDNPFTVFINDLIITFQEKIDFAFSTMFDFFDFVGKQIEDEGFIKGFVGVVKDIATGGEEFQKFRSAESIGGFDDASMGQTFNIIEQEQVKANIINQEIANGINVLNENLAKKDLGTTTTNVISTNGSQPTDYNKFKKRGGRLQ